MLLAMLPCCRAYGAESPLATSQSISNYLSLQECIQRVVQFNETIQVRALEWLASQKRLKAAKGIFEPEFVGSVEHTINRRKTTAERKSALGFLDLFDEENTVYSGALEFLAPTGGKLRLGYSLRDLANNLQRTLAVGGREFESFAGVSLVQPLLKNAGVGATMAAIRLAAGESELAYQEYRRQMMLIVARAEIAYWDLYLAQEQDRIRQDSVRIANTLLEDNRVRVQVGRVSDLDVLQSEAGVALRQARRKEAQQKLVEGINRLTALFSSTGAYANQQVRASDEPVLREVEMSFLSAMRQAIELNPDYLSQRRQLQQEGLRVAYARNQLWPQLDLKASYGLNGLGDSVGNSMRDIQRLDYQNWSVGAEMRIPLAGGAKARNELAAVRLRQQEAILGLKSAEVEIANALETARSRVVSARDSVANYRKVVDYNQRLLETETARLDARRAAKSWKLKRTWRWPKAPPSRTLSTSKRPWSSGS
jgi:outer membrane protein TolC